MAYIFPLLTAILGVSFFVSKSGVFIAGGGLIILSTFMTNWKSPKAQRPWLIPVVALYIFAIILSFGSLGGAQSALHTAISLLYILIALPFSFIWESPKLKKIFLILALVGLAGSCGYAIYNFFTQFGGVYNPQIRVESFLDVSRWGLALNTAGIGLYLLLISAHGRNKKIGLLIGLLIVLACLVLSGSRAPMLGFVAAILFVTIVFNRKFLKGLLYTIFFFTIIAVFLPSVRTRISSIFNVHTNNGAITSSDISNASRIHMWTVALDFFKEQPFFGTGMENTEPYLRQFIESQSEEYQAKHITSQFSFRDQHSSFLNVLVQFGVIYFLIFYGTLLWIFRAAWSPTKIKSSLERQFAWGGILSFFIVAIFYGEITSFGSIFFWPLIPLLFFEKSTTPRKTS